VPGGRGQDQVCEAGAGKKRRVLIRSAADITQLQEGDRGVPTICNSPFVDEVIPPNIGVRYALGRIYRDGPDHCVPTLEALGISAADFTVVYVVPREKWSDFQLPGLGQIRVCATVTEKITYAVLKALCTKRKRDKQRLDLWMGNGPACST
jgi:hypothetical protein